MNREQAKQLLPIIQAFADGETIQFKDEFGEWFDVASWIEPMFRGETEYRIKPRPLERWVVMDKDGDIRSPGFSTEKRAIADCKRFNEEGGFAPYRVVHMREVAE